ncbi:MAG TPA: ribonuclease Z [Puia sp.]|nr:ribonuclease Z [Puia sp.]
MFAVTILGNNSALPAFDRHPTAQVVTMDEHVFLIDCGEGTQSQMSKFKIRRSKINHVFISHLHGDHYFGLIGLITSMGLLGRVHDLHVFAPPQLKSIIDMQLNLADTQLPFALHFHCLSEPGIILKDNKVEVTSFRVYHRIECWGFCFRQVKPFRKINPEKARNYDIPPSFFDRLKWGEDFFRADGSLVKNDWVTEEMPKAKAYAYAADTIYDERILESIHDVDVLYHESTYLSDLEDRAIKRFHSTAAQAARMALKAGVKRLLLGHFSSKYETLEGFESEARLVFPNSDLALEGVSYRI